MTAINEFINPFLNTIGDFLPSVLGAIIILILGWLVIEALTRGVGKLLGMLKLDEKIKGGGDAAPVKISKILTRIFRYVLLLCLLLLVLDILGVQGALDPVRGMFDKLLGVVPNIIAGFLIGVLGYIIARMVAGAVTLLLSRLDTFSPRMGLPKSFSLSRVAGQLVFIFTFVPILIAALDTINLQSVSVPATEMLRELMLAIPNILAAALILVVAFLVGRFVANTVGELLKNLGLDRLPETLGLREVFTEKFTLSRLIGGIVLLFIMLAATISATEKMEMVKLSELIGNLTQFAGAIALGLIILAVGNFLATVAYQALSKSGTSPFLAGLARVAIVGLVAAMGLHTMGIADGIVRLAFGFTIGAAAVAFALAFGLGGREAAGKQLAAWFSKLDKE